MNIQITVEAPGLTQALENLAAALASKPLPISVGNAPSEGQKVSEEKTSTKKETAKKEALVNEEKQEMVIDEAQADAEEKTTITLVTVRSYLQKLQDAGRQKDAKAILTDLGHKKLSDVPEEDYPVIIAKVEELLA